MSCNNLTVSVSDSLAGVTIAAGGEKHGHVVSATPTAIVYSNTGLYGPDARVVISKDGKAASIIECQQNYCMAEGGDITVTPVAGAKADCKTIGGSFAGQKGGQIIIEKLA